ncbi:50S ribosomal protein L11 methyltransferase [bacterium]|nr:50S ribosomal protein L11 methyltransferase [bacterium]
MMKEPDTHSSWFLVTVPGDTAAYEALSNFLFEMGAAGVEEGEKAVMGYFQAIEDTDRLKNRLRLFIRDLNKMQFSVGDPAITEHPDEDWSAGWRDYFQPVYAGERFVIKAPWHQIEVPSGVIAIDIMPRMAFGTGSHETTQLCLRLVQKFVHENSRVLDIGSGSGILAIAAAKLGARCMALEIDADALGNTHENIGINGVGPRIDVLHGSTEAVAAGIFDVILANINRIELLKIIPGIRRFVHPETIFIISGILVHEADELAAALQNQGFRIADRLRQGEWAGMAAVADDSSQSAIE